MKRMTCMLMLALVLTAVTACMCAVAVDTKAIPIYTGKPGTKIGEMRVNPKDGAEMMWVPAGEFTMGSSDEDISALLKADPDLKSVIEMYDQEKPQHKVYLNGYWIYKYEVTVAQYRQFCKAGERKMPDAPGWGWKDNHPMVFVTWQDAVDYAKWAEVSLPSEAQWEKAARGTDGRIYPWGNKWDALKCASSVARKLESTQPVGSFTTGVSPYGCMDMAGNVYEWCGDWYDREYYKNTPTKNPIGPLKAVPLHMMNSTFSGARVLRGGSWYDTDDYLLRCAIRYFDITDKTAMFYRPDDYGFGGFRCAKTP